MATTSVCTKSSLLHLLPPELRLQILRHLLLATKPVQMVRDERKCRDCHEKLDDFTLFPSILRTCRLLHEEGLGVLYSENCFLVSHIETSNPHVPRIVRGALKADILGGFTNVVHANVRELTRYLAQYPKIRHVRAVAQLFPIAKVEAQEYLRTFATELHRRGFELDLALFCKYSFTTDVGFPDTFFRISTATFVKACDESVNHSVVMV